MSVCGEVLSDVFTKSWIFFFPLSAFYVARTLSALGFVFNDDISRWNLENRFQWARQISNANGDLPDEEEDKLKQRKYFWAVTTNNEYLKTVKKAVYNAYPVRTRVPPLRGDGGFIRAMATDRRQTVLLSTPHT